MTVRFLQFHHKKRKQAAHCTQRARRSKKALKKSMTLILSLCVRSRRKRPKRLPQTRHRPRALHKSSISVLGFSSRQLQRAQCPQRVTDALKWMIGLAARASESPPTARSIQLQASMEHLRKQMHRSPKSKLLSTATPKMLTFDPTSLVLRPASRRLMKAVITPRRAA